MSDPTQSPGPGPPSDPDLPGPTPPPVPDPERPAEAPVPQRRPSGFDDKGHVRRTRSSAAWWGAVSAAVLMVLLLVFIVQNSDPVRFRFFGWAGEMPLAVAVLAAAVVGVLLVAIPGSLRIYQLRRALVKNQKRTEP